MSSGVVIGFELKTEMGGKTVGAEIGELGSKVILLVSGNSAGKAVGTGVSVWGCVGTEKVEEPEMGGGGAKEGEAMGSTFSIGLVMGAGSGSNWGVLEA